jgi:long-subunit fatty acid transport protein
VLNRARPLRRLATAAALAAAWSCARPAGAQSTAQIPLQFDFQTPGARSMAMGGAFIGAADDSSAAFTNPGGLGFLVAAGKSELSLEGRLTSTSTPFLSSGRISGVPTGQGFDTVGGPVYQTDADRELVPGFVAVVFPVRRVVVAAYRHQMVSIENSFFDQGVFERFTFAGITDDNNRELPVGGTRQVRISSYGASLGYKLNPRVSIGGGLSANHFTLDASFARFGFATTIFGDVAKNIQSATATQSGDDVAPAFNAGVLVKATERLQLAATMRRGPRFTFTQVDRVFDLGFDLTRVGRFKVPDIWGAGLQWAPAENLRLLVDYDRVQYSQIAHDFIDFQALSSGRQDQVRIDDANEWHAGAEYQWRQNLTARPVAFRAGVWRDPSHAPYYVSTPQHDQLDVLLGATLPGGRTLVHYTFGAGTLLSDSLEVNGAADLSSGTKAATVSAVVRF